MMLSKFICFHDWETIERMNKTTLEYQVEYNTDEPCPYYCRLDKYEFIKVCLKCGKYVDTVTPAKERYSNRLQIIKERKEQAQHILNMTTEE